MSLARIAGHNDLSDGFNKHVPAERIEQTLCATNNCVRLEGCAIVSWTPEQPSYTSPAAVARYMSLFRTHSEHRVRSHSSAGMSKQTSCEMMTLVCSAYDPA